MSEGQACWPLLPLCLPTDLCTQKLSTPSVDQLTSAHPDLVIFHRRPTSGPGKWVSFLTLCLKCAESDRKMGGGHKVCHLEVYHPKTKYHATRSPEKIDEGGEGVGIVGHD